MIFKGFTLQEVNIVTYSLYFPETLTTMHPFSIIILNCYLVLSEYMLFFLCIISLFILSNHVPSKYLFMCHFELKEVPLWLFGI